MCQVIYLMLYSIVWYVYRFDEFRPLSMCSRPYISVFEITKIPSSFLFPKIPYRFHFRWKKYESENGGVFRRSFPTVFIHKKTQSLNFGPKMETIRALEARLKYLAVQSGLKPISSLATKKRSSPIWYGLVYPKFKLPKLSYRILRHLHEKLNINKIKS